jgi:uncharacterized membrane protein
MFFAPATHARRNDEQARRFFDHGTLVTAAVTIQRSASDLYAAWRRFSELPRFIDRLRSVQVIDRTRSRWLAAGPGGKDYSWDAEVIREEPGSVLAWRSLKNAQVASAGTIRFHELPHGRGTEVRLSIEYVPPGRGIVDALARPAGVDGAAIARDALHRFRQVMETGEGPLAHAAATRRVAWRAAGRLGRAPHAGAGT